MAQGMLETFIKSFWIIITCRYRSPKKRIGEIVKVKKSGKQYYIFKESKIKTFKKNKSKPLAIYEVEFHFKMNDKLSIFLTPLMVPFFISMPGLSHKLWLHDKKSGDFAGIYKFETLKDANNYGNSFAQKIVGRIVVKGSHSYKVFPLEDENKFKN